MANLVILKVGTALGWLRAKRGDFEDYFSAALGVPLERCRVVDPRAGEAFPAPDQCRAVVITGSPEMITNDPDWSLKSEQWLRDLVDHEIPILGICYGHQLLAKALGGRVGWTPQGLEIGTKNVTFDGSAGARLFWSDIPSYLTVQVCHSQSVLELPPGAKLLASSSHDPVHGFVWGDRVWGFQFHPEFDAEILRAYIDVEASNLREAGRDPQEVLAQTQESDDGQKFLRAFSTYANATA